MSEKYSAVIEAADSAAIEEIQMFLPVYLVEAEQKPRMARRRSADDITAALIQEEIKEVMSLILYRVTSPESVLKHDAHKLSYVLIAAEGALNHTRDDFERADIRGNLEALRLIREIASAQYKHFKDHAAAAFPIIVKTAQNALNGVYPAG